MIKIKGQTTKILSLVLCGTLLCSAVGVGAYAAGVKKTENIATEQTDNTEAVTEDNSDEVRKDETVYVIAGADGSVKKVIVSDWIKNSLKSPSITDSTDLENITNVKGDEYYSINSDNMKVWDAEGNDIYYTGDIDKEIPVNMNISYKLNGETVSAEELAGASGEVTIRFDYTNNQYEMVEIDGQQEKIYVPFVMITGMMLDNEKFSNVRVSNGKVINDGSHTIVAGLALPGLSDNLQLNSDVIEIPDYVEITADVEDFELTTTLTLATNEMFNGMDLGELDSVNDLEDSMNKLSDAMSQLLDGSSQLYDGLSTLLNKSDELIGYIDQFAAASKELKDGAAQVDAGAGELKTYINQLSSGLNELTSNNDQLNGGAKQVFTTLLSTAETQLNAAGIDVPSLTVENYDTVLDQVIKSLDPDNVYQQALATVTAKVEESRDEVEEAVTAKVRSNVKDSVVAEYKKQILTQVLQNLGMGMTADEYESAVKAGNIDEQTANRINIVVDQNFAKVSEDTINALVDQQMAKDNVKALIAQNTQAQIDILIKQYMQDKSVTSKFEEASKGLAQVSALKSSLDSYNEFYTGLLKYTAGVASAASGASQIADGVDQLKNGTAQLAAGTSEFYDKLTQLQSGSGALVDGVGQLKDGAMQLSEGLKQFNNEGVQKLIDAVDGDLGGLAARLKATIDVSKDYKSFAGISDDMDGSVRFIYKTDAIEKSDN